MEEERRLYPFRFCLLQDDYPWGSEAFQLADLGYRDSLVREGWLAGNSISEVMDTYLDRVVGEKVYGYYGRQFPVCVRRLHVRGRMPLRVHPDDVTAAQRYDFLGKEKCWYVLRAGSGARLMAGFRRDTDASEFYAKCLDGSAEDLLNGVAPHAGLCLRIPAGTPHAAAGDVEILEIAESSPMDFCLCSWGEALHPDEFDASLTLADALDFIDYRRFSLPPVLPERPDRLVDLPQLRIDRLRLDGALDVRNGEGESFALYSCMRGSASVQLPAGSGKMSGTALETGETLLVPAECEAYRLVPAGQDAVLLKTTVVRSDEDPYSGESVSAA